MVNNKLMLVYCTDRSVPNAFARLVGFPLHSLGARNARSVSPCDNTDSSVLWSALQC